MRVIAQSATTQQTPQLNASTAADANSAVSLGFGDALVKATAGGTRGVANAAAENHNARKPVDKKSDTATATPSKSEKTTQSAESQPLVVTTSKSPTTVLPLQALATGVNTPAGEATGSEDVLGSNDGTSKQALAFLTTATNDNIAARGGQASASQTNTASIPGPAAQQGTTSASASSVGVAEKQPVSLHQAPLAQMAGIKRNGVQAQQAADEAESTDQTSAAMKPGSSEAASDDDAPVATSAVAPSRDGDPSTSLGIALPIVPTAFVDSTNSDLGLNGNDSAAGVDLSSGSLSSLATGTSNTVAPGVSALSTKSKAGTSGAASAAPPTSASSQKSAEPTLSVAPAADQPGATANAVSAQTNAQAALTVTGAAHTDAKGGQHSTGEASGDTAATALATPGAQSWDASAAQVVHRAQLIQAMHQSEMRMGMNSAEFGNISISAAVSHQTLLAQISLDHPELNRALTAQLPNIEKQLGSAYGLPSRVEVRDSSTSSQQGSSRRNNDRTQSNVKGISSVSATGLAVADFGRDSASSTPYSPAEGARLDILI